MFHPKEEKTNLLYRTVSVTWMFATRPQEKETSLLYRTDGAAWWCVPPPREDQPATQLVLLVVCSTPHAKEENTSQLPTVLIPPTIPQPVTLD